jgi:hypothetical protein
VRKRLLEAGIAVALEETVRNFVASLLPYVWVAILLGLTWEIANSSTVIKAAQKLAGAGRYRMLSYLAVAIVGGSVACLYWWGVQKTLPAIENGNDAEDKGVRLSAIIDSKIFGEIKDEPNRSMLVLVVSVRNTGTPSIAEG